MALAYDRDPDVLDRAPTAKNVETGTAARLAAEKMRPKFEALGASTAQAAAMVEAFRLILINDVGRAKDALETQFSTEEINAVFPLLLSGLQNAA